MQEPGRARTPGLLRRGLGAVAALAVSLSVLAATPAAAAPVAEPPASAENASRFTLAVIPDTQFYSRYSADQFMPRYGTDPFAEQTKWLAANADELKIPFAAHLGDVVDRVGVENEWMAADAAMQTLDDAKLPYSILPGNHDVRNSTDTHLDTDYNLAEEPFLDYFGPNRAAGVPTYGGSDPTGLSQYHVFEAEGQQFMVLALTWRASAATLAWADQVMAAHPTVPVILTTHSLLNIEADGVTPRETEYGLQLWDDLIRQNDQIFMTFNGHFHGASKLTKTNDFGNSVTQVVIDYQMAYEGGNGYLGLYEFDLTNNRISALAASPWVVSKPQESLTSYDQPFLEGEHQQYAIDLDFADRFSGFNPDFAAGPATTPSLTERARSLLLEGFEGPDPITTALPGNELDYTTVPDTLAHWRFNGLDGTVGADTVIPDVAGTSDLRRPDPATTNAVGAAWDDVRVQSDNVHGYSSDGAAVCFDNASKAANRFSYLTTAADAPVNSADLSRGYTIETFLQLSPEFSSDDNGWSKAVVHSGNRSHMPDFPPTRWDYTASPTALGISNLREFQFTGIPADATKGDRTNWSGEIMPDSWAHVAIVGDPEAQSITMYVDGAPVLRNATDSLGLSGIPGMPWVLGSDWVNDAAINGWNGCIGETRIVARATDASEWLTQRADLSTLAITDAPSGTLPAGTAAVQLAGTGFAGAVVQVEGAAETAVVDAAGSWSLAVPVSGEGVQTLDVSQGLGERRSDATQVSFELAVAPVVTPGPTTEPTTPGQTPAPTGAPGATAAPGDSSDDASGSPDETAAEEALATTGAEGLAGIFAGALIVVALGAALIALRRQRHRA